VSPLFFLLVLDLPNPLPEFVAESNLIMLGLVIRGMSHIFPERSNFLFLLSSLCRHYGGGSCNVLRERLIKLFCDVSSLPAIALSPVYFLTPILGKDQGL